MHIYLSPSALQLARMRADTSNLPKWFANPLSEAFSDISFGRSIFDIVNMSVKRDRPVLIFNVGGVEVAHSCIPGFGRRTIALHQWKPRHLSSAASYAVRRRILSNSAAVVTYSQNDVEALKREFPRANIHWIGHFVDTEYFSVGVDQSRSEDSEYLLAVGDHLRLESILQAISERIGVKLIRVTSSNEVAQKYTQCQKNVELRYRIPFDELRDLYRRATFVLNAVDDRYWPVGITSFCEALAMSANLVTSGGNSCSGYLFPDGYRPYAEVRDIFSLEAWIKAIDQASRVQKNSCARQLAVEKCSLGAVTSQWAEVKDSIGY